MGTVHPHVCGEGPVGALEPRRRLGSPPRVWGRRDGVGKARQLAPGSPPRVWGRRRAPTGGTGSPSVHPHVCGEGRTTCASRAPRVRFTPTCVGKASSEPLKLREAHGSPPRVWGRRQPTRSICRTCPVHPHVCGEGGTSSDPQPAMHGSPPRVWGRRSPDRSRWPRKSVHPHVCGEGSVAHPTNAAAFGSPPRVWGRRAAVAAGLVGGRFTPTCVGKALLALGTAQKFNGSPPRVWGRRSAAPRATSGRRFTPTCVGKALPRRVRGPRPRFTPTCVGKAAGREVLSYVPTVHPHVCGEGFDHFSKLAIGFGSPPRVWGRLAQPLPNPSIPLPVHPHVCGEGSPGRTSGKFRSGSPPRVWGRPDAANPNPGAGRFTPTCVGKAPTGSWPRPGSTVHPHVCGEGDRSSSSCISTPGSPPRVWGRRPRRRTRRAPPTVHPHVCGEGIRAAAEQDDRYGSPPRVWGRQLDARFFLMSRRFTPTCVGKASGPPRSRTTATVHPHVCGEGVSASGTQPSSPGSPPRVWGRRPRGRPRRSTASVHPHVCGEGARRPLPRGRRHRFTPTCVGQAGGWFRAPLPERGSPPRVWGRRGRGRPRGTARPVHPHVCGEGALTSSMIWPMRGSPPRVWGRRG